MVFSITLFFVSCTNEGGNFFTDNETIVGIQPFGNISKEEVDSVKLSISEMYDFKVKILPTLKLPEMSYTEIRYPRYRADSLVKWLTDNKADSIDIIVGLTNQDISITKYQKGTKKIKEPSWQYIDFGIYGLGRIGGEACVVSSNRLKKGASTKQFYKRVCRISCHEVGHVLGLRHCPSKNCLMNDANEKISTIDNSTGKLCDKCYNQIN